MSPSETIEDNTISLAINPEPGLFVCYKPGLFVSNKQSTRLNFDCSSLQKLALSLLAILKIRISKGFYACKEPIEVRLDEVEKAYLTSIERKATNFIINNPLLHWHILAEYKVIMDKILSSQIVSFIKSRDQNCEFISFLTYCVLRKEPSYYDQLKEMLKENESVSLKEVFNTCCFNQGRAEEIQELWKEVSTFSFVNAAFSFLKAEEEIRGKFMVFSSVISAEQFVGEGSDGY